MTFKRKSTKKVEAVKAAPTKVDMAEEEVKSVEKIAVVPPKPVSKAPPMDPNGKAAKWLREVGNK